MTGGRWSDLKTRIFSAIILLAIGAGSLWLGPIGFGCFVIALVVAMHWELGRMLSPLSIQALWFSAAFSFVTCFGLYYIDSLTYQILLIAMMAGVQSTCFMSLKLRGAAYSFGITLSGLVLYQLDTEFGAMAVLWLLGLVIVTDIAGYFAGRILGGPKFWPRFSPKKTWSGALAGWLAAIILSIWALPKLGVDLPVGSTIVLAIILSFASQMGDIFESAIKRRCDIKDSSNLIPGHGGVLDRMDGMVGAGLAFGLLAPWIM